MGELRERIENHVALGPGASPGFYLSAEDLQEIARALKAADEIERLRLTLVTIRLFIEDETVANAVVVQEGTDARDPNNPSLLQLIDRALGPEQ